jgi:hypothetical protein
MKKPQVRFPGCLEAAAMALSMMAIGTARADQVEIGNPMPMAPVVNETRLGHGDVTFEIVNTGVPDLSTVTLGEITETLVAVSGDTKLDVIVMSATFGCSSKMLDIADSCKQTASYNILDGDPFDKKEADPGLPPAVWRFGISVPWTDAKGSSGTATDSVLITVRDAPVPEPSTFFLFGSGLLGVAGVLRSRLRARS